MNKDLVIKRLQATMEMLLALDESKFDYHSIVKQFDENECGTVCCVGGWYPKWFPESKLKWVMVNMLGSVKPHLTINNMSDKLEAWHGLNWYIISVLFYGECGLGLDGNLAASTEEVYKRFERVLNLIQSNKLPYNTDTLQFEHYFETSNI